MDGKSVNTIFIDNKWIPSCWEEKNWEKSLLKLLKDVHTVIYLVCVIGRRLREQPQTMEEKKMGKTE